MSQLSSSTAVQSISPLASLTAAEIQLVRDALVDAGAVTEHTRFAYLGLDEPNRLEVLAGDGTNVPRNARALTLDLDSGAVMDHLVSLPDGVVERSTSIPAEQGGAPVLDSDHDRVREILVADPNYVAAIERRGVSIEDTVSVALSAGHYDIPGEEGRRLMRTFSLYRETPEHLPWARPIDGLVAYVDTISREVVQIIDDQLLPIPPENGEFTGEDVTGPLRTTLKPIEITQPEGASFSIDGERLTWENWSLSLSFDAREGLILRQIGFEDDGRVRPILYRASIGEMVVPYGDPAAARFWQNYFDTGEYIFGRYANSLELGCDCLGEIQYLDAVVADESGSPHTIKNAICIHEEDFGILWKHTDMFTGAAETRRQRRLVISFFTTVGNYDYGFYWYLYLDGTIECEAKATGIVFVGAQPSPDYPYTTEIAPGVGAPVHQHLFCARLDVTVDGPSNSLYEVDAVRVPMGPGNPYGNGFTKRETLVKSEAESGRDADASVGRVWHIVNEESRNFLGQPVAYALIPSANPTLLADPESSIAKRATFATKHLWATAYDPEERYPAGDFVNQHPGGAGIPSYITANRDLHQTDLVLWHTFGPTHFPRTEDWPIMPVDMFKFTLKPYGFFDRNPTLNLPASAGSHSAHDSESGDGHSCHHSA